MNDPNADYKATFARLTASLGRPPISRDSGWLAMHEEYKRAWAPAIETVTKPERKSQWDGHTNPVPTVGRPTSVPDTGRQSSSTVAAPIATASTEQLPTASDGIGDEPRRRQLAPGSDAAGRHVPTEDDVRAREEDGAADQPLSGPGINADGQGGASAPGAGSGPSQLLQGGRGPNGGVMATCGKCGRAWEREKRRGRPSLMCGECR